ncbi:inclusion body family protein [Xenorhabdus miraniensis]|uniref:Methionine-rich PixA inclusion body protein n=1 Tax=Xenorhabdus miraniensis TaxID=351674 RepID=A0A2D0JLY0_9GAMM|nr:inclusion body family protein [Xenorhabdus miraniensis]PHM47323.1 methionine-rich PixA inclusion body protein [Xenorhabdus miraniensis]PHM47965.1 methionine-rich PixA inclusion body protein [Xenorhabdus miraniensis]
MANVIDILVTVDAQSIMEDYGKISNNINAPTFLSNGNKYIHMLAKSKYVIQGQGGSDLQVKAKNGDTIRWRGVTLSKDSEYSAALLKLYPVFQTPTEASYFFVPPEVKPIHSYVPVLKSDNPVPNPNPLEVDLQEIFSYYWDITVKNMPPPGNAATEYYAFIVGIYDNGNFRGYVNWDPAIILDNR